MFREVAGARSGGPQAWDLHWGEEQQQPSLPLPNVVATNIWPEGARPGSPAHPLLSSALTSCDVP